MRIFLMDFTIKRQRIFAYEEVFNKKEWKKRP